VTLHEEARLLEVARLAGRPGELREPDLDLGVAADAIAPAGPELRAHEIGGAHGDAQQPVVRTRARAFARHRRLEEMAEAVQLVAPLEVGPPRALALAAELGVEVPVGLLGCRDTADDGAEPRFEVGVVGAADLPGQRLEVLVHLGVRELASPAPRRQRAGGGAVEVAQPALGFQAALDVRERVAAVDGLPLAPEAAGDADLLLTERAEAAARRSDGRLGRGGGLHGHPLKAPDMNPRT
jgi:hypothetical protein